MHSRHTITTGQEELHALANKSSPCPHTTMLTAAAQPTLKTSAEPNMLRPKAPTTGLIATEEWRIAMGKAT
jgi:hypothetical protein